MNLLTEKKEKNLEIIKTVLILAGPIIISNLLQSAYYMIDTYWLGHVGKEAVATIITASPLIMLLSAIGIGLSVGCSTLIAQYYGAKKHKEISKIAGQTMTLSFISAIIINLIGFFLAPQILGLMNVDPLIFDDAISFIRIACIGMFFSFLCFNFSGIMRAIGKPQIPTFMQLITVGLNFILAPFLVFGLFGIGGLGVIGAAIITVICQFIFLLIVIYALVSGRFGLKLTLKDLKPDWKIFKKTILISIPSSIEQGARNISMIILMGIINTFGIIAAAAYGASFIVTQVIIFSAIGFGIASGIVVGQNLGAGNMKYAKKIAKVCAKFSGIFFAITSVILFIFAPIIIKAFIPGELETIKISVSAVRIMSVGYTLLGINIVLANSLIAAGKTKITMLITIFTQVFMLPLAYFLSNYTDLGITGVWLAFPIANISNIILTYSYFTFGNWNKENLVKDK